MEMNLPSQNPRPNISVVDSVYGGGVPISVSTTSLLYVVTVCGGVGLKRRKHQFQKPRTSLAQVFTLLFQNNLQPQFRSMNLSMFLQFAQFFL